MHTLIKPKHIKILIFLLGAVLLAFPQYALSETNIRLIHQEKITHGDFAKRVGINQETSLWPLNRCPRLFSEITKDISRHQIELVIICNALKREKFADNIQFVPGGNPQRQTIELAKGNGDLLGHSIFRESLSQTEQPTTSSFLLTDPVIKQDQFIVGIFTSANQLEEVSKAFRENELNTLIATTVSSWKIDVKTLQSMPIKSLHLLPSYTLIFPNLARKRANFTLFSLNEKGQFSRVDGYKVALADDRVFIVNKNRPELYNALQSYIVYLREQDDLLTKAYEHAGFISDKYRNWKQIN